MTDGQLLAMSGPAIVDQGLAALSMALAVWHALNLYEISNCSALAIGQ